MLQELKEQFRSPASQYRGAPFWSWNDDLNEKEIRRQIRQMKRAGIGGFFMHSRGGLETPFLSEAWFGICDAAIDEAARQGMLAWAYDEDRWPSGVAGGIVTDRFPEAAGRVLEAVQQDRPPSLTAGVIACFRARRGAWKRLAKSDRNDQGPYLVFYEHIMQPSDWFNGRPPLDVLNRDAVRRFIEVAYAPYVERYRAELGKTLPGVFTDEPNFFPGRAAQGRRGIVLPWGRGVLDEFRRRRGYDLADHLPALIGEKTLAGKAADEVRCDYWLTLTELFVENFSAQIGRFCGRHGMALTGHYLAEESMVGQTLVGGAVMPHYVHQHLPGIDILCRRTHELLTVKQAASVARQWGRNRLLSELYGASGWDFTLEDQKRIGDWQYALGVNYRCQHLALYSLRGERKRDYPPSHMPHQPWWKHYKLVEDYFARVSLVLSLGKPVREVAVLHPIRSVWAETALPRGRRDGPHRDLDAKLNELIDRLLYSQVDFDFIDEILLAEAGGVNGGSIYVNKARYEILIVPEATYLAASTAKAILQAAKGGLNVFFVGSGPIKVYDSRLSARTLSRLTRDLNALLKKCKISVAALPQRLKSLMAEPLEISPAARVLYQLRADGRQRILFLTNQEDKPLDLTVRVIGGRDLTFWDAETGRKSPYPAEVTADGVVFRLRLEKAGSAVLSYLKARPTKATSTRGASARPARLKKVALPARLAYQLDRPNVLLLDRAAIRVTDTDIAFEGFVPQIARTVRSIWGYPDTHYYAKQPWTWPAKAPSGKQVILTYSFNVKDVPKGRLLLGVERPERKQIRLNGRLVRNRPEGFYLDRTIPTLRLGRLKKGRNTIEIREELDIAFEAEAIYLLGAFGVKDRVVTALPPTLRPGDWTAQGLPYFAGSVTYLVPVAVAEAGTYEVEVAFKGAAAVGVGLRGGRMTHRAFAPWRFAVPLRKGKNVLAIELVNTLRNLMGPHHCAEPHPIWVGPTELAPDEPVDRYVYIPSGLFAIKMGKRPAR